MTVLTAQATARVSVHLTISLDDQAMNKVTVLNGLDSAYAYCGTDWTEAVYSAYRFAKLFNVAVTYDHSLAAAATDEDRDALRAYVLNQRDAA